MTTSTSSAPAVGRPDAFPRRANPVRLWFGILGAPTAWAIQLVVSDGLTELGCARTGTTLLNVLTVALTFAAASVGVAAFLVSVVAWRSSRGGGDAHVERAAFMSEIGMVSSAIFLVLILVSGLLPHVFLDTCAR